VADYNVVLPKTSLPDLGKANADLASHKENITLFDQTSPVTSAVVENTSSKDYIFYRYSFDDEGV
jgi:hypothetical protein